MNRSSAIRPLAAGLLSACAGLFVLAAPAAAQLAVGPPRLLPGDAVRAPAVEQQELPAIAAGDGTYLAVWQERRTVLGALPLNGDAPFSMRLGNARDVYAARIAADGSLLDPEPLVISNAGHNQTRPAVAWNGSHWLVVYARQRPAEFSLHRDLVAVRVSAAGGVVDPQPIVIRSQQAAGQALEGAAVASDGDGWAVVWNEFNDAGVRGVHGARVSASGVLLDPAGVALFYDMFNSYASDVAIGWGGGRYLVVWSQGDGQLDALRLDGGLRPLDPAPFHIDGGGAGVPSVASDGSGFLVAFLDAVNVNQSRVAAARVTGGGSVLDPAGLSLTEPQFTLMAASAAWDGTDYVVAYPRTPAASSFVFDVYSRRVGTGGTVGPEVPVAAAAGSLELPEVASLGDGSAEVVWTAHGAGAAASGADVVGAAVAGDGTVGAPVDISAGLPRQTRSRVAAHPSGQLMVYLSETSGGSRVLAQRLTAAGLPLGGPVEIARGGESQLGHPDLAWNGASYLAVWQASGGVFGRRLAADGTPLGPPHILLAGHTLPSVGALGGDFLVAGVELHFFHEPQSWLGVARVSGADGQPIDLEPALVRGGFELESRTVALGGRWLVVWESQARHDTSSSSIRAAFVGADGVPETPFLVDGSGTGDDPDVALSGDGGEALVVWHGTPGDGTAVFARRVAADGTLPGGRIDVADAAHDQVTPAVAWDGTGYQVAWVDYRALTGLEQLRGDLWAARVAADGTVLDPGGGVQVTSGPLPEELPELFGATGVAGGAVVAYAGFPQPPETYRLVLRGLGAASGLGMLFADDFESGDLGAWTQAVGAP